MRVSHGWKYALSASFPVIEDAFKSIYTIQLYSGCCQGNLDISGNIIGVSSYQPETPKNLTV
ncbi:MAG: hypothetical protein GXY05_14385 [Clostridiales bacterium]|nr:hypothetical protein [Clostridiales bacterium]